MAEELLYDTEVGAVVEHVCGEAVPEGVGRDVLLDAGGLGGSLHDPLNGPRGQVAVGTAAGK